MRRRLTSRSTYPPNGDPTHGYIGDAAQPGHIGSKKPWMRGVFFGGLIGALAVGLLLGFYY